MSLPHSSIRLAQEIWLKRFTRPFSLWSGHETSLVPGSHPARLTTPK